MGALWRHQRLIAAFVLAVLLFAQAEARGVTSAYRRRLEAAEDMPLDADVFAVPPGHNAPQQVHVTLGDQAGTAMTVSWVTVDEVGNSTVMYGRAMGKLDMAAEGTHTRYKYHNYTSGFIHHCTLTGLEHGTKYYYVMGFGHTVRTFWFTTPPKPGPDVPFRLGLIGDLGQTSDSNSTLTHYEARGGDAVLFMGDLSYADKHPLHDNNRWDTWGRFSERSVAYQPWIWVTGNHEVDYAPELIEQWIVDARVDLVFAGHVHAYERSHRVSNIKYNITDGRCKPVRDRRAPVYMTIGDGGNIEGLADSMTEPQPSYSAFREASFGHAVLDIKNRTHAYYAWYRNADGAKVAADTVWFTNRYYMPNHDDSR